MHPFDLARKAVASASRKARSPRVMRHRFDTSRFFPLAIGAIACLLVSSLRADPVKLNGPLVAGGQVTFIYVISPDSSRVVYVADQETDEQEELYVASIDGSATPIKLNDTLIADGDVFDPVVIAPDGTRVVYRADRDTENSWELFSVPIDGSAMPAKLNNALSPTGFTANQQITPDSARVVFIATDVSSGPFELFSAPIDGSAAAVKLNDALASGGRVFSFEISPDGSTVVYRADEQVDNEVRLYAVPTDDSAAPTPLTTDLMSNEDAGQGYFTPDGSRVVYDATQVGTVGHNAIFSVPSDGSTNPVRLSADLDLNGFVSGFEISPDGSTVIYLADQDTDEVNELYSVPVDGSAAPTKLSGTLVAGGDVQLFGQTSHISPDSQTAVFVADKETDQVFEAYIVPLDGSAAPVKLNDPLVAGGRVIRVRYSPDGTRVLYLADQETDDFFEIYSVPPDRSTPPVKLSDPADGGIQLEIAVAPNSSALTYAVRDQASVAALFAAPVDGSSEPTELTGTIIGEDISGPVISPNSARVVYRADAEINEVFELYSVPLQLAPGDADNDGVFDDVDNCVNTPNPMQSDVDGDGVGDLCDVCPGDDSDSCNVGGSVAGEVEAAAGGTIETPDGAVTLEFDPGDLPADTTVSVTELQPGDEGVDLVVGPNSGRGRTVAAYVFEPEGLVFDAPVTLTVVIDVSDLGQRQRDFIDLYLEDPSGDFQALGAVCNVVEDPADTFIATCTAEIDHFSVYAMIAPLDSDGDGVFDLFEGEQDNCPLTFNPDQLDVDGDGIGEACDRFVHGFESDDA